MPLLGTKFRFQTVRYGLASFKKSSGFPGLFLFLLSGVVRGTTLVRKLRARARSLQPVSPRLFRNGLLSTAAAYRFAPLCRRDAPDVLIHDQCADGFERGRRVIGIRPERGGSFENGKSGLYQNPARAKILSLGGKRLP